MNAPTLPDSLRPWLSRVIGAVVAGAVAGITKRYAFDVTPEQQQNITDWGVTAATTLVLGVYAAIHRGASAKVNPTDAASPALASVATGPLGEGERTRLATRLDAAAEGVVKVAPVPRPPVQPEIVQRPPEARPPTFEPLVSGIPETSLLGSVNEFAEPTPLIQIPDRRRAVPEVPPADAPAPAKKKRAPRKRAVIPPEPGAPPPQTVVNEPSEGFEP